MSLVSEASSNIRSEFVGSEGRGLVNKEPLAPIGTPTVDTDVQTGLRSHTSRYNFSHENWKISWKCRIAL